MWPFQFTVLILALFIWEALAGGPNRSRSRSRSPQRSSPSPQRRTASPARIRTNGVIKLTIRGRNVLGDTAYEIPIGLGTPRQPFDVLVDSGSRRLVVPYRDVTISFGLERNFTGDELEIAMYDERHSETRHLVADEDSIGYMSGRVRGLAFQDRFSIGHGPRAIPLSHSTSFIAANGMEFLETGIIGLAPEAEIWRQLQDDGLIRHRIATVSLKRRPVRQEFCRDCGKITLGMIDRKLCGNTLATMPMAADAVNWESHILAATFNEIGAFNPAAGFPALIDTGSSAFRFPSDVAETLAEAMGAEWIDGAYRVPCKGRWRHKFELLMPGRVRLQFSRDEMITKFAANNCQLMILPHHGDNYVLGVPFLLKYCVILNAESNQIVVAKKKSGLFGIFG